MKIEELLASRTDLSTFLVHLTRSSGGETAKQKLIKILTDQKLLPGTPMGAAVKALAQAGADSVSQKTVCFTETPLEHLSLLTNEIDGRTCKFEPYGVAITRKQGRKGGVNPIWYLDITPGHNWLTNPINSLIKAAIDSGNFAQSEIAKIAPFIEQMGAGPGDPATGAPPYRKEFWWEREWRRVGEYELPLRYIVLCPRSELVEIKAVVDGLDPMDAPKVSYVDPSWSLESIIGMLAGFASDELGPF